MNIIKGLDRIILVLAIISMPLGFTVGYDEYRYTKAVKIYGDDKPPAAYIYHSSYEPSPIMMYEGNVPPNLKAVEKAYKIYHPPVWQSVIAGFLGAFVAFPVVLFSLRGLTRGTRWFFLWILAGFKDEKKE